MDTLTAGNAPQAVGADIDAPAAAAPRCHIVRLFGTFSVSAPDGSVGPPVGRKARALLAYLLLARGESAPRDRLAALLWSERGDDQARASLRQTLHELRALSVGAALLRLERSQIGIVLGSAQTDVDTLRSLEQVPDAVALAALIGDQPRELLMDFDGIDPAYDEWLAVERVQRRDERRRIVLTVATSAWGAGDVAGAHRLAMSLLAADSYDEAAARIAMQASHARGDRDGVRMIYGRLEAALRRDMQLAPSEETRLLHQRLMVGAAGRGATALATDDAVAVSTAPAMAALPRTAPSPVPSAEIAQLQAMVDPASSEALAVPPGAGPPLSVAASATSAGEIGRRAAITPRHVWAAALMLVLAVSALLWQRHRDLAVGRRAMWVQPLQVAAADSAARALKVGLSADLARVMVGSDATLDVIDATRPSRPADARPDFVVTGEAQSSDGMLHANIQLRSEREGEILWSNSFERSAGDVDALREQMAAKVADVAVCALGGHNPTLDELGTETMRLYLSGCEHKHGDWALSAKLMKQVTERRPAFAHGWAMLAAATAVSAVLVPDTVAKPMQSEAIVYAQRALALDPRDGEAYFAQAEALPGLHNWRRRQQLLQTSLAAEPANAQVLSTLAEDMSTVGRWHEAIDDARLALDADPFSPGKIAHYGSLLAEGDAVPRAHDVLDAASKRFPKQRWITKASFLVDAYGGDADHAARTLDEPQPGFKLNAGVEPWKIFLQARRDPTPANVDAAVRSVHALAAVSGQSRMDLIVKLTMLGRLDDAYALAVTLTAEQVDDDALEVLFWSVSAPLRADPRFMTLAARYGLVAIWQKTDLWPDFCSDHSVTYDCRVEAKRAAEAVASR